jgi:hypothetical protein
MRSRRIDDAKLQQQQLGQISSARERISYLQLSDEMQPVSGFGEGLGVIRRRELSPDPK